MSLVLTQPYFLLFTLLEHDVLPGHSVSQHAWSGSSQSASVSHLVVGVSGQSGGGGGFSSQVP